MILLGAAALAGPATVPAEAVDEGRAAALFRGRRLALLVGPDHFDDPRFAPLRFTDDDATALAEAFSDPAGGRFDRVWTLTGESDLEDVRAAMAELSAASLSPDDTVFVYFSTHGTLGRDPDGSLAQYLVLADSRLDELGVTALSHAEVHAWLDGLASERKVLLLATCHSGRGKSVLSDEVAAELAGVKGALTPLQEVSEATVLLGVCAWNETARESEELGHDIYTAWFLEALERADLDGDGAVTVTEAHDHARRRTYETTGGQQRPYARVEVLGEDPIVLSGERGSAASGTLGSWADRLAGYLVLIDGEEKGALPGLVPVEPGRHEVELRSPDGQRVVARRSLRFVAGEELGVDQLLRRDLVRVGGGGGLFATGLEGTGGPQLGGQVHLPQLLPGAWELVLHGELGARLEHPTLAGGATFERPVTPGALHLRLGGSLEGYALRAPGDPPVLAPSLVPMPVVSAVWLPRSELFVRLAGSGGYLWSTDAGAWRHGCGAQVSLAAGLAFGQGRTYSR